MSLARLSELALTSFLVGQASNFLWNGAGTGRSVGLAILTLLALIWVAIYDITSTGEGRMNSRVLANRLYRYWLELLGAKAYPPPYSKDRADAWRAGYDAAVRDLAELKAWSVLDR